MWRAALVVPWQLENNFDICILDDDREASFDYILAEYEGRKRAFCIVAFVEPSRVYSRTKESYRLPWRTATVPGGCSLFRFRLLLVPAVLPSRSPDARAFSFLPWLTLGSHSIRPSRSVVTARRLYKFYIIFMRHKVVEKPTEEKRERVRARAGGAAEGKLLGPNHPSRFPVTPASRHCSHVAGRSGSHPLVLARRRGARGTGQAGDVEGDATPR